MRETYAERKERHRQRDAIRAYGSAVADHVAGADLLSVEWAEPGTWPPLKFSRPVPVNRCECGLPMVPLPRFFKRWGILPCWYCVVCNLEGVVKACERVREEAARHGPAKRKATGAVAA